MAKYIVTTSIKTKPVLEKKALEYAESLNIPYVKRKKKPIEALIKEHGVQSIIIVEEKKTSLLTPGGVYFFHPSMAKVRIKSLKNGHPDQMIAAMELSSGDSVLDCTLGLGSDAIVASFVVGGSGKVTGLEGVSVLAEIVKRGLKEYIDSDPLINEAMRRIEVINKPYQEYLKSLKDNSYDIVYFDPMFRKPLRRSSSMSPLRKIADNTPLEIEWLNEASRVARKRVVMKETRGSREFERLKFSSVIGGKYSPVAYGVIEV